MGKGKDLKKRTRRKATAAEKAERNKKKEAERAQREEENARAGYARLFSYLPHSVPPNNNKRDTETNSETESVGHPEDTDEETHQELEEQATTGISLGDASAYQELDCPRRVHGVADLTSNIIADIDAEGDDHDDDLTDGNSEADSFLHGVMKHYIDKIQEQLRKESSSEFPALRKKWLHVYLKDNDFWIRKSNAMWLCRKLNIRFDEYL